MNYCRFYINSLFVRVGLKFLKYSLWATHTSKCLLGNGCILRNDISQEACCSDLLQLVLLLVLLLLLFIVNM